MNPDLNPAGATPVAPNIDPATPISSTPAASASSTGAAPFQRKPRFGKGQNRPKPAAPVTVPLTKA